MQTRVFFLAWTVLLCDALSTGAQQPVADFAVRVVDAESGRGVPLVELKTVNDVSYWTDSAGYAAIREPSWVDQAVYFHVASHGYEYPADKFDYRGVRLTVKPGQSATIKLPRKNLAERLYRVTGEGIYRDSQLLGKPLPIDKPLLNAGVLGSDSVLTAVFRDRLYWFWGDTDFPNYPLGIFHSPGATSKLPRHGGLNPSVGVNLDYFVDERGFAKPTCRMPGDGPTWIHGLTVLGGDEPESQTMWVGYSKIQPPLSVYEHGVVQWDDDAQQFVHRATFPATQQALPLGHPVLANANGDVLERSNLTGDDSEHDLAYVYYCHPLPLVRVRATPEAIVDPKQYEVYSYVRETNEDGAGDEDDVKLDRDDNGKLVWKWRVGATLPTRELENRLVKQGRLADDERAFRMRTHDSDRRWTLHTSSIAWNEYRDCWVMIGLEVGGESSFLGEVYYLESRSLAGPWSPGIKIVTHDAYSFYNPRLHEVFSEAGGRVLFFEGTYTHTFSRAKQATPRYDYNQLMYRLDLDDLPLPEKN